MHRLSFSTITLLTVILVPLFGNTSINGQNGSQNHLASSDVSMEDRIAATRKVLAENSDTNAAVLQMFDETVALWKDYYTKQKGQFDLPTLLDGVAFAAIKHKGATRKDAAKTPYIVHPIGVARQLWEIGNVRKVNVLVAALLHDTLEDTDTSSQEIEDYFGPRVRYTVEEVSNDPNLSGQENKQRQIEHAPTLSMDAALVKLSDRLYNVRDLRTPPPSWGPAEVDRYREWGVRLLQALRGTNEALEKALDQEIRDQRSAKA